MENAKLGPFQLFSLIVLFEIGTALMLPLGLDAKQDAWVAILVGLVGGLLLYWIYYSLYLQYPDLLLTSYIKKILGNYLGSILALLYILFFIYGAARDLRDGMELLMISYTETPMSVLGLLLMAILVYGVFLGIEVLGRAAEILLMFLLFMTALGILLVFLSGIAEMNKLLPILENGWKPVLTTVIGQTIMFPFGEMICFTMLLPYLNNRTTGLKLGLTAVSFSGITLAFIIALEISVLGVDITSNSIFPFLKVMQKINVGDIIQRPDSFVMVSLIVNDFFKIAIFFYAALIGAADLFKVSKNKLVIPVGIVILITSILIADNTSEHFAEGKFALKYIFTTFCFLIPLLLLIGNLFRHQIRRQ
ncbi:GerAB/ArcD/ProY family transporter [Paenibacillus tarimensis]